MSEPPKHPPVMSVGVAVEEGCAVAVVAGEIDMATAPEMIAAVQAVIEDQPAAVLVDLAAVTFFASAGVHALVVLHDLAQRHSVPVGLVHSEIVGHVLTISSLPELLDTYPTRRMALDALTG
ncbi:STAS domain-containing protein [Actinokineospora guangxiensis]|uniref:STAS domain-containing protein n=1 Tax=Actinokineospora guangxiensis TaxID=1490288 RepID=A0ABW0EYB1_9PSEU